LDQLATTVKDASPSAHDEAISQGNWPGGSDRSHNFANLLLSFSLSQDRNRIRWGFFLVTLFFSTFGLGILFEFFLVGDHRMDQGVGNALSRSTVNLASRWSLLGREQKERNERFSLSIDRHRGEVESLIKNLSGSSHQPKKLTLNAPKTPHSYSADEFRQPSEFDFGLLKHSGFDARWQPVNGTTDKFYVYSAFYDGRGGKRIVRVVGAAKTKKADKVWCRLLYKTEEEDEREAGKEEQRREDDENLYEGCDEGCSVARFAARVLATVHVVKENWNLKYSAIFVLCPVPESPPEGLPEGAPPASVSVLADSSPASAAPTNQLPVLNREQGSTEAMASSGAKLTSSDSMGVCVKPIHFNYNQTLELIEFIELNRLLGASGFTFYNDTMSETTSCVLKEYAREGLVNVLPCLGS